MPLGTVAHTQHLGPRRKTEGKPARTGSQHLQSYFMREVTKETLSVLRKRVL